MGDWEDMCDEFNLPYDSDTGDVVDFFTANDNCNHNDQNEVPIVFKNLQEVKEFAMMNPGHTFVRNPDGPEYTIKKPYDNKFSSQTIKNNSARDVSAFKNHFKKHKDKDIGINDIVRFWYLISYETSGILNIELLNKVLDQFYQHELQSLLLPILKKELKKSREIMNHFEKRGKQKDCLNWSQIFYDTKIMIEAVENRI